MSLLIDSLTEYWMVDDVLLSDSDSVVPMVYLVLRFEIIEASYVTQNINQIINTIKWFHHQNPKFNNLPLFDDGNQ